MKKQLQKNVTTYSRFLLTGLLLLAISITARAQAPTVTQPNITTAITTGVSPATTGDVITTTWDAGADNNPAATATFDGADDYVPSISMDVGLPSSFALWAKPSSLDASDNVLIGENGTEFIFDFNDGTHIRLRTRDINLNNTEVNWPITPADYLNNWKHILVVNDGTNFSLYVDGQLVSTQAPNAAAPASKTTTVQIASRQNGSAVFNGQLSDVRIFNKALSGAEVSDIYNGSTSVATANLLVHYPMAEGVGTTIHDVSGNGNHGKAKNITQSSFWANTQDQFHYNLTKGFKQKAKFDGVDDYINTNFHLSNLSSANTTEFEFNINIAEYAVGTARKALVSGYDGGGAQRWSLDLYQNKIYLFHAKTSIIFTFVPSLNTTYKMKFSFDFVNDTLIFSVDNGNTFSSTKNIHADFELNTNTNLYIGRFGLANTQFFKGEIYDLKVSKNGSIVLNYPMSEGEGTAINDVSGNATMVLLSILQRQIFGKEQYQLF